MERSSVKCSVFDTYSEVRYCGYETEGKVVISEVSQGLIVYISDSNEVSCLLRGGYHWSRKIKNIGGGGGGGGQPDQFVY